MWCLFFSFRKGKRAVDASDSDESSSDDEDEKEKNNGSQVESSGSGMAGAHDGDSSGKDVVVVHQSSDVLKGETTGVQVINEGKVDDLLVGAMVQTEKEDNLYKDAEKNLVEVACETVVDVKNQGNDSEAKQEGVAGETETVDAVCCKPVEPLNFDDFSSAKDMEVCNRFILLICKIQIIMMSFRKSNCFSQPCIKILTKLLSISVVLVSGYGDGKTKDRASVTWTEMRRDTARAGCKALLT